jgi:glycosyltransferase involved in cell wall biosynthesis
MQVSIIIPTYQGEKYLSRSIRSAIDQSYPRELYEIVVIDDGSTDNSAQVLKTYGDDIRLLRHKKNLGLPAARNTGLKNAKGRFVLNLDADDYLHDDILTVGALFLNMNNDFDAVSFDYFLVDDNENHIQRLSADINPIACGIMFRKEKIIDIGLYDEKFLVREEEDLRKRFLKKYTIQNIELPLYRYRRHDNNMTNNFKMMEEYKSILRTKHN